MNILIKQQIQQKKILYILMKAELILIYTENMLILKEGRKFKRTNIATAKCEKK